MKSSYLLGVHGFWASMGIPAKPYSKWPFLDYFSAEASSNQPVDKSNYCGGEIRSTRTFISTRYMPKMNTQRHGLGENRTRCVVVPFGLTRASRRPPQNVRNRHVVGKTQQSKLAKEQHPGFQRGPPP